MIRHLAPLLSGLILVLASQASRSAADENPGPAIAVTQFRDRSTTDEFPWLEDALTELARSALAARGVPTVPYEDLSSVAAERAMDTTGLPADGADPRTATLKCNLAVQGEFQVDDRELLVRLTVSRIEPQAVLGEVEKTGEVTTITGMIQDATAEVLALVRADTGAAAPANSAGAWVLPGYEFLRWYHEGKQYESARMAPEAWYCFTQALKQDPDHFHARVHLIRCYRAMQMHEHAILELDALFDAAPHFTEQNPPSAASLQYGDPAIEHARQRRAGYGAALAESLDTLWEAAADPLAVDTPLWTPLTPALDKLHRTIADYDSDRRAFGDAISPETLARVESVERLHLSLLYAACRARFAHVRRDEAEAARRFEAARGAWQELRPLLTPRDAGPEDIAAFEKLLDQEAAWLAQSYTPQRPEFMDEPESARPPARKPDPVAEGLEWSTPSLAGIPSWFTPYRMVTGRDGERLLLGAAEWQSSTQRTSVDWRGKETLYQPMATWYGFLRSVDDGPWTGPTFFPAPVNEPPGDRHTGVNPPLLMYRSCGEYLLIWERDLLRNPARVSSLDPNLLLFAEPGSIGRDAAFCATSNDLVRWSAPVRLPILGPFDAAELPNGHMLVAGRNGMLTQSADVRDWSIPRSPLEQTILQGAVSQSDARGAGGWRKAHRIRLLVDEDRSIHLVAILGVGTRSEELLVHASSLDAKQWALTLMQDPDRTTRADMLLAQPVGGGGIVLILMSEEEQPHPTKPDRPPVTRKFNDFYLLDGTTCWRRSLRQDRERLRSFQAPTWGGLEYDSQGVNWTLQHKGYQSTVRIGRALFASGECTDMIADDALGPAWTEPAGTITSIVIDTMPNPEGQAELHSANSLALLIGRDLEQLKDVRTLMCGHHRSGVAFSSEDLASACRAPGARWADYLLQAQVSRTPGGFQFAVRLLDVPEARVAWEESVSGSADELAAMQKKLARGLVTFLALPFRDAVCEERFRTSLAWKPLSYELFADLQFRGRFGLVSRDQVADPGLAWLQADPDSSLANEFAAAVVRRAPGHVGTYSKDELESYAFYQQHYGFDPEQAFSTDEPLNPCREVILGKNRSFSAQDRNFEALRIERVLAEMPRCADLRRRAALEWVEDGIPKRAFPHIEHLLKTLPDDRAVCATVARVHESIGDLARAGDAWARYVELFGPDACEPFASVEHVRVCFGGDVHLAIARNHAGRWAEALPALEAYVAAHPVDPQHPAAAEIIAYSHYLHALTQLGRDRETLQQCDRLTQLAPTAKTWRIMLAVRRIDALRRPEDRAERRRALLLLVSVIDDLGGEGWTFDRLRPLMLCPQPWSLRAELFAAQRRRPLLGH